MGAYNSPMSGGRHERIFPARRDTLPQIAAFLAEVCAAASFSREGCLRLTLLVEELFTNTVTHGHGGDSEAPVRLVCDVTEGHIALDYEDTGPPYDPFTAMSRPDLTARVDDRRVGGLGVLLVSAMARQVAYRRVGDTNRISLVVGR
jgi:serine/threonine-protein kinase RsbW